MVNGSEDQTWELTIRVQVTTMCGWEPDSGDVERYLDDGGVLELVAIDKIQEVTRNG
jgi:hypothetical protein